MILSSILLIALTWLYVVITRAPKQKHPETFINQTLLAAAILTIGILLIVLSAS